MKARPAMQNGLFLFLFVTMTFLLISYIVVMLSKQPYTASLIFIASALMTLTSFAQKKAHEPIKFPPPVLPIQYPAYTDACQLNKNGIDTVYTRFLYSGVDEYWNLYSPGKDCQSVNAYLEIPDSFNNSTTILTNFKKDIGIINQGEKNFLDALKFVHEHYRNKYLQIDAIGVFNKNATTKYGMLGSNDSKFTIIDIVQFQILDKRSK